MTPRASLRHLGASSPLNAGTKYRPAGHEHRNHLPKDYLRCKRKEAEEHVVNARGASKAAHAFTTAACKEPRLALIAISYMLWRRRQGEALL
jgi:hypothetical protein